MAVTVTTPVFEGPFEVLMQLVLDHKVDVCDVPIAPVVDGFLAHVATRLAEPDTELDLAEVSEFLLIAAILVELKSKKLLPGPDEIDTDEEFAGLEHRDILLSRLVELQAYSAAAIDFGLLIEQAARSLPRTAGLDERFTNLAPDLLAGVGPMQMLAAYRKATVARPSLELDLHHVTVEQVSVSETLTELEAYLPATGETTFGDLTSHLKTRMQVIVRFLALLELHKRGKVVLEQGETFGDLHIQWIATANAHGADPEARYASIGPDEADPGETQEGGDGPEGRRETEVDDMHRHARAHAHAQFRRTPVLAVTDEYDG